MDINITFETLFELLRLEKRNGELQQVPEGFLEEVATYVRNKESVMESLTPDEKEQSLRQLTNAKRIVHEMLLVRERKLLELARLRAGTSLKEDENMTPSEKAFFMTVKDKIVDYRLSQKSVHPKAILKTKKVIEFTHNVQKFVGKEFEEYGPYTAGEKIELPIEIATFLVSRGKAKETPKGI